jgi:hypothetical protein
MLKISNPDIKEPNKNYMLKYSELCALIYGDPVLDGSLVPFTLLSRFLISVALCLHFD